MFLSDGIAFIDTLMPLNICCGGKKSQSSHKDAFNTAAFLAHTLIPLFLQTDPIMFDVLGFSFPNTFSLSSSLSCSLSTYPAVKLYCSLRL